ncbi:MAG: TauD/TfdA family dioxygenase [Legionellales bacterium]
MSYAGVTTRFLRADERHIPVSLTTLPLVIEAKEQKDLDFLTNFLSSHSSELKRDIATYGAVLLRGFKVTTTEAFEQTVLSISGMQGMSHLFMSEPGRTLVDNLKYVFHTNTKMKTGGAFTLGGFHNENYYSPDVPSYISFYCLKPSKWGGETGLIHMNSVYEKLDVSLKEKLEKSAFPVAKWPIAFVSQRYKISKEEVKKICGDFGLSVVNDEFLLMSKPSVINDIGTDKKVIQANLGAEIPSLNEAVLSLFMSDYHGIKWVLHKMVWKLLGYQKQRKLFFTLGAFFKNPLLFVRFFKKRQDMQKRLNQYNSTQSSRISSVFEDKDVPILAALIRDSYAAFTWQANDVLLIDNLQVAHAGMPGRTTKKHPREIRAMLCNPLKINYAENAAGVQKHPGVRTETLGECMHKAGIENVIKI